MAIITSKPYQKGLFEDIENSVCYHAMPYDIRSSVQRFFEFLNNNYSINDLALINRDHLISYLKHHKSQKFKEQEFTSVIKDLKNVLIFLNKSDIYERNISLDLSLQNIYLWINI